MQNESIIMSNFFMIDPPLSGYQIQIYWFVEKLYMPHDQKLIKTIVKAKYIVSTGLIRENQILRHQIILGLVHCLNIRRVG